MGKESKKLMSIQGLRGIAILMVYLCHTQIFLSDKFSLFSKWGGVGVYFFISISGGLLAYYYDHYKYIGTFREGFHLACRKVKKLYWLHLLMWFASAIIAIKSMSKIKLIIYSLFNLTLTQSYIPFSGIVHLYELYL